MRKSVPILALVLLTAVVILRRDVPAKEEKLRYYLGEQACRACHAGRNPKSPCNVWRLSKHAQAYSALAMPEAFEIAELSGVDAHPQKSPICLGCHTTAPTAEEWEVEEGFRRMDGIQCEACHGPGSDYAVEEIMVVRERAVEAGLIIPTVDDCIVCHEEKGTHVAVVGSKEFDPESAMKEIEHSKEGAAKGLIPAQPPANPLARPHYVGVWACGECHRGPEMGHQLSVWRRSKHALAYAVLGTMEAQDIARREGISEHPQSSPECLDCHTTGFGEPREKFAPRFQKEDGVQCEACHGPGSEYAPEAVMLDPMAAALAGLEEPGEKMCLGCHLGGPCNSDNFRYEVAVKKIAHRTKPDQKVAQVIYKTPVNICLSADGTLLFVACEESNSLIVADTQTRSVIAEIPVGRQPHDVCLSPDERRAYVTNRMDDSLSVVDLSKRETVATVPTGDEPHGVVTDASGETIYVVNYGTGDVSVIDAGTLKPIKRLAAARGPWSLARSPDGKYIYVTNNLPHFVEFRTTSRSEVTIIDTEKRIVVDRAILVDANLVQGIDFSPDGEFALVTLLRTKNLVPMTRITQGWTVTNGLGILWADGRIDQVLLDEVNSYFADPTDVAITPDGRFAYVTGGGIDAVAVVDLGRLKELLNSCTDFQRKEVIPNHLGYPVEYVIKRIAVGASPRGVTVSRDGKFVYVANGLSDSVSIIDVTKQEAVGVIDLEGPDVITLARRGNRVFHSAKITFQQQFSCHTCHPDGNVDGITYDIEPDGIGRNPVDNRTLRGILDTAPFKWKGTNPTLQRQCGPRLAVFFTRIDPFTPDQLKALEYYICTIPRPPNRYRGLGEDLTPAQRRGKAMFERTVDNLGREIPKEQRCNYCHFGPYYTNRTRVNVDTQSWLDDHAVFDVPHLNNIYETAPYLHDGRASTLEEIWTRFNPNDRHGLTSDMTKDQLNDLIEYLKTL